MTNPTTYVMCDDCDARHEATYSHDGEFEQGPVYAVVCGEFVDYYLTERVFTA
jgi:hypothetical protein